MAAARRGAAFLGLWLLLAGSDPVGLVFGIPAAALAVWASLRLLPPSGRAMRLGPALVLGLELVRDSVAAGFDVARRALDPRLPIRPGTIPVALKLPRGLARDGFRVLASLQPGALPAGLDAQGRLVVHALDTALPVQREVQAAEALFTAATGQDAAHG
ncbi:MAG TPA: Na+/H+ antiporter subunit E [Acetobacteraceae bacterium]|nr:Na+/H+ antiporter subunit E [Acetobacteraceae bacterium]